MSRERLITKPDVYPGMIYFFFWNGQLQCEAACYLLRSYTGSGRKAKDNNLFWMMSRWNAEHTQLFVLVWLSDWFTLSCLRTRSMKNFQQFSLVSISPEPRTSDLTLPMTFSTSSSGNRSGISPWINEISHVTTGKTTEIVGSTHCDWFLLES